MFAHDVVIASVAASEDFEVHLAAPVFLSIARTARIRSLLATYLPTRLR
jgi:hypothetical protein